MYNKKYAVYSAHLYMLLIVRKTKTIKVPVLMNTWSASSNGTNAANIYIYAVGILFALFDTCVCL